MAGCEVVHTGRVEDRGPAPGAFPRGHRLVSGQGGSESGSVVAADGILEAELAWVMSAWGGLSPDTRAAILAIVEAVDLHSSPGVQPIGVQSTSHPFSGSCVNGLLAY